MQEAVSEPETHKYPSNRGREEFRGAVRDFYERRFDVKLEPESEIVPALGAKEAIFNLNLAFLDPGTTRWRPTRDIRCIRAGRGWRAGSRC